VISGRISEHSQKTAGRAWKTLLIVATCTVVGCNGRNDDSEATDTEYLRKFSQGRYAVRLRAPVVLRTQTGEVVGRLEPGSIIQSPSIDDVGDADISDNWRMKVVFNIADREKWEKVDGLPVLQGAADGSTGTIDQ
jgi:hypothetical protein